MLSMQRLYSIHKEIVFYIFHRMNAFSLIRNWFTVLYLLCLKQLLGEQVVAALTIRIKHQALRSQVSQIYIWTYWVKLLLKQIHSTHNISQNISFLRAIKLEQQQYMFKPFMYHVRKEGTISQSTLAAFMMNSICNSNANKYNVKKFLTAHERQQKYSAQHEVSQKGSKLKFGRIRVLGSYPRNLEGLY
ncbi:unnamed protein product (macronuclear) [Paramecium tetraurelia]|uniref:Uncharacterized protein n=1 Tax=Paramecium tetraurelia TaxID=5888 RepID=A0EBW0_PARTE|nr:uncharacterized protein GSPATT00025512001 [Paramecium tetraurelia]CAK92777.1 unnamed protein product [Paramecium tetraurelia]|eukprot:XP_001460174.1 hypothetical protein (macronuclear) [Paramecium tetraurelia strain d4-2]